MTWLRRGLDKREFTIHPSTLTRFLLTYSPEPWSQVRILLSKIENGLLAKMAYWRIYLFIFNVRPSHLNVLCFYENTTTGCIEQMFTSLARPSLRYVCGAISTIMFPWHAKIFPLRIYLRLRYCSFYENLN